MANDLFDLSEKYEAMLAEGLKLSGEPAAFFVQGRLRDLRSRLPATWQPRRILDFGCGIGDTTQALSALFPGAQVTGLDTSVNALQRAVDKYRTPGISFGHIDALPAVESFDLCYVNGVFHHIDPARWPEGVRSLRRTLVPGGYLAFFENNPWNPGTRLVMRRIPFDRDAHPLSPRTAGGLIRQAGFRALQTRFLFYFPRMLSFLRFIEPGLARLPLGAQYYVLAQK